MGRLLLEIKSVCIIQPCLLHLSHQNQVQGTSLYMISLQLQAKGLGSASQRVLLSILRVFYVIYDLFLSSVAMGILFPLSPILLMDFECFPQPFLLF